MTSAQKKYSDGMKEEAMKTLRKASQNFEEDRDYGFTQWSAVYNLPKGTLKLAVHMDYEHIYKYSIN